MTGSGTVSDPYLVADVYDFCSMNSGYYKLINDIDFNDHNTYKYGVTRQIIGGNGFAIYLDGDGHEVRNIVCSNNNRKFCFNNGSVSNTNFANIIVSGISSSSGIRTQIFADNFTNCNFGYYMSKSAFASIFGDNSDYKTSFVDCTFNIAGSVTYTYYYANFNMCHINFKNLNVTGSSLFDSSYTSTTFSNTYITGSINTSSLMYLFNEKASAYPTIRNSYLAVATDYSGLGWVDNNGYGKFSLFCIDKTLMPHMGTSKSGVYLLTSEQFKDNNYLNSIGFLAIPV